MVACGSTTLVPEKAITCLIESIKRKFPNTWMGVVGLIIHQVFHAGDERVDFSRGSV